MFKCQFSHNFGHITFPTHSRLVFYIFFRRFATFVYYVINRLISVTTQPILTILLCVNNFCFNIVGAYGVVCYYLKEFSFSLKVFLSFPFVWYFVIFPLKYSYSCFSFCCFFLSCIAFLFVLVVSELLLTAVISLSLLFLMHSSSLLNDASTQSSMLANIFHLLFLTHKICHFSDIRPCASSTTFLSSGSVFGVPPLSILKKVLSILLGGQPRWLSIWWYFCCRNWSPEVFSFIWGTLFLSFFLHLRLVDGVQFENSLDL